MPVSLDPNETIAAISSPVSPGFRGIVRLSGPEAWGIAERVVLLDQPSPFPRHAAFRSGAITIVDGGASLPATVAFFRGPRSYTAQDLAEIHTLGSPPLLQWVLAACLREGARGAEPGEFTLRAFLAGRIDLTQAEAVLGVINAHTKAQVEAALEQLSGGLSGPVLGLRHRLLDLLATLEANLDFSEEPDVDPLHHQSFMDALFDSAADLRRLANRIGERDRAEQIPRVVLIGRPNAGKSRLFNALLGEERAIVAPRAGTTRDYLTAPCTCGEVVVELIDTAGIDEATGFIDREAQRLRDRSCGGAEVVILCNPADGEPIPFDLVPRETPVLSIVTKADLLGSRPAREETTLYTSAQTGEGLPQLRSAIEALIARSNPEIQLLASSGARCRPCLSKAAESLQAAAHALTSDAGVELAAFELRMALEELGRIVGETATDDVLDRIFRRFCIGK